MATPMVRGAAAASCREARALVRALLGRRTKEQHRRDRSDHLRRVEAVELIEDIVFVIGVDQRRKFLDRENI